MRRSIISALGAIVLIASAQPVWAAGDPRADVSHPLNSVFESQRAPSAQTASLRADGPKDELTRPDIAGLAIVDNGDGVSIPDNPFDLEGRTVEILPADPEGFFYTYRSRSGGFDSDAAAGGVLLSLEDDDFVEHKLPFPFPFFGKIHESVFVNSDGNLTFEAGDDSTALRDPARAVSGPPRIFPLFIDLDPSQPGAGVKLFSSPEKVVVTWANVPEFVSGGLGRIQTFQATLFPGGGIEFSYASITRDELIVGVASAELLEESLVVDFSAPEGGPFRAAFVEIFVGPDLSLGVLAQKFYLNHDDAYDFVVIFHNYDIGIETGAFAFYRGIRNFVQGIGPAPIGFEDENVFDFGNLFGSPFRLQGLLFMGDLEKYGDDPNGRIGQGLGVNTSLSVLGHEAGHRFLSRALFVEPTLGLLSTEMLGRQFAHWSFFYNSDASLLEGNRIIDRGSAPLQFETTAAAEGFSSLDLYLMGLVPPDDVEPSFVVRNPSIDDPSFNAARQPLGGILFDGERIDVPIESVTAALGRRRPDDRLSQKAFRYAFILLVEEGTEPTSEEIENLNRLREAFSGYMAEKTSGRFQAETELVRMLALTTSPQSGLLRGERIEASVVLGSVEPSDVEVRLETDGGIVGVPESVVIPAGQLGGVFPIEGLQGGVASLNARIDESYETARSRIQVLADTTPLRLERLFPLEILFNDPRERLITFPVGRRLPYGLLLLALDDNDLPYADAPISITASGDGFAESEQTHTDAFGSIVLNWTLATTPGANTLTVEVEGSARPPLVVEAVGTAPPTRSRNPKIFLFP